MRWAADVERGQDAQEFGWAALAASAWRCSQLREERHAISITAPSRFSMPKPQAPSTIPPSARPTAAHKPHDEIAQALNRLECVRRVKIKSHYD